jgi:hypothetical protein
VKKRDIGASQCDLGRSVGEAQLQEDGAGAPRYGLCRAHEVSKLGLLDPTHEQEPLGPIACGMVVVELELLDEYRRGIGASLDAQQTRGHVVGARSSFLDNPLQESRRRCLGPERGECAREPLGAEQLGSHPRLRDAVGVEAQL